MRFYAVDDAPFRFVVYDLDLVNSRKIEAHPLEFIRSPTKYSPKDAIKNPVTDLFNILYKDPDFKDQFHNRYQLILDGNLLSFDKFNDIVDTNFETIEAFMPTHIDKYDDINTMVEWYRNIELLKENFKKREQHLKNLSPLF